MNVLIIASGDYFSTYGGGQIYVKNLVYGLNKKNIEVSVINCTLNNKKFIEQNGIKIYNLDCNDLDSIKNLIKKIKPDLIHAHGNKALFTKIAKELKISIIITMHHGGMICPNGMLLKKDEIICNEVIDYNKCLDCTLHYLPGGKFFGRLIKTIPKKEKISIWFKNKKLLPYVTPPFLAPLIVKNKFQEKEIIKQADKIIAPSNKVKEVLEKHDFESKKVTIIPHGVKQLKIKEKKDIQKEKIIFGYVGRIDYVKGLHIAIEAFKKVKNNNWEFHIYGAPANKKEEKYYKLLLKQTKKLPVFWKGKVLYAEIENIYRQIDLLIFPSICFEPFGLVVNESLSAEIPVITSKCGGPEDMIIDGVNGFLVEPNNVGQLADKIEKILKKREIMANLNPTVYFTFEEHMKKIIELYNQVGDKK